MRVLLIDDNPKLNEVLAQGMRETGFAVETAGTGADGAHLAGFGTFDVIVLDRMLPDRDGLDVCRQLRQKGIQTPILMLTGLGAIEERVTGLNAGADDYLPKPFEFDELVARVRALMRRGQATESTTLRHADLEMDLVRRTVKRGETSIRTTAKEFALLEFFIRRPNRVLSRTAIAEHVWEIDYEPESNVIDVYVSMLRRKIDQGFEPTLLHTVIGAGYILSADGLPQ